MEKTAFSPADILLPHDCGLTKWAVVACDQYTSQPEYWERVDQYVGDAPSTLRLILPESKLESDNVDEEIQKINATMEQYLQEERLRPVEDAMIFVERKLANGKTRLGLLGKLDLEEYSYEKGSGTPIRATEGTVLSRIPPRMKVRENAPIELPHIMVLIDDPDKKIIEPLTKDVNRKQMSKIYSATLMENGGRITGSQEDPGGPGRAGGPAAVRGILPRPRQARAHLRHGGWEPLPGHRQGLLGKAQAHPLPPGAGDPPRPVCPGGAGEPPRRLPGV